MKNTVNGKVRMSELKTKMVNVRGDLWYEIKNYFTTADGYITEVQGDNGNWYKLEDVVGLQ